MLRFLLPCQCGQKLQVSADQAGDEVPCACGRTVAVPTLRGLQSLERLQSDSPASAAARQWNFRSGLGFLGLAISLVGLALVGVTFAVGPKRPAWPTETVEPVDLSSPESVMHALVGSIGNTGIAPPRKPTGPELRQMQTDIIEYHFWRELRVWMAVVAGVGLLVAVVSRFLPKRRANIRR
jgi:hypothetical protein